jgi:hypothetical protein
VPIRSALLLLTIPAIAAAQDASQGEVRFNRDVRSILADNCFQCHGPDSTTREADLRLDTRDGLFAVRDHGPVVKSGNADASELWRRVSSDDPDKRMPPADSGKSLSREQMDVLRRWIEEGAPWESHWAFIPPERSRPPRISNASWPRNAIDRFVLQGLERRGLSPSGEAMPETLIRRVTLDLTGLPPTPGEVDAYLADPAPDRYERLVERLLASPRYGEHLAVDWLDAARYADTSGYQNDGPREMWRWRDWVIDACNAGMPFDQFTIEQLAGDLLPNPTLEQRIATGFNRNHRGNAEGGIIPEEYAVEYVVDRVDTTGAVWLGLTVGCGRCHDHKFDPLSQAEYYGLYAYFNSIPESGRAIKEGNSPPYIKAPTEDQHAALVQLESLFNEAQRNWDRLSKDSQAAQTEWERTVAGGAPLDWSPTEGLIASFPLDGTTADVVDVSRRAGLVGRRMEFVAGPRGKAVELDGESFLDAGDVAKFGYFDEFSVSAWLRPEGARTGGIVSRMSDDSDADGWTIHLREGRVQVNLVKRWLDDSLRVETETELPAGAWRNVTVVYDGSRVAGGVKVYFDGEPQPLRVHLDALNQTFANEQPLRIGSTGTQQGLQGAIADVRVYCGELSGVAARVLSVLEPLQGLAAIPASSRTAAQSAKLREYFLKHAAPEPIRTAQARLRSIEQQREELIDSIPTTMVMAELETPRPAFVLERGAYDHPGPRVHRGVPEVLAGSHKVGGNRLDLARWLVDGANPLTARVAVNRHWQRLFGAGLVKTVEDFGAQGEPPSHPELLDWLATEFVRTGWDVKGLQRLIVTSATYRQSSEISTELKTLDPENRLLARGPRVRFSAEVIRDQALEAAGLLTERIGGPSVKPYQPAGLWNEIATDTAYEQSTGADLYRRSLYSYTKRTVANPTLTLFDAGTREACTLRRSRTNTPLQSLTLLNDITFVEAARALAERVLRHAGEDDGRLSLLFRLVTSRGLKEEERMILKRALAAHREHYRSDRSAALAVIEVGESVANPALDVVELAAFTAVAEVVLNLDEVVTKE